MSVGRYYLQVLTSVGRYYDQVLTSVGRYYVQVLTSVGRYYPHLWGIRNINWDVISHSREPDLHFSGRCYFELHEAQGKM